MSDHGYYDEFGFYSPMPLDRAARREPQADFPTGPEVGTLLPPVASPTSTARWWTSPSSAARRVRWSCSTAPLTGDRRA